MFFSSNCEIWKCHIILCNLSHLVFLARTWRSLFWACHGSAPACLFSELISIIFCRMNPHYIFFLLQVTEAVNLKRAETTAFRKASRLKKYTFWILRQKKSKSYHQVKNEVDRRVQILFKCCCEQCKNTTRFSRWNFKVYLMIRFWFFLSQN